MSRSAQRSTLPANVGTWEQPAEASRGSRLPRTPKGQVLLVFGVLLGIGIVGESGWTAVAQHVTIAVAVACLLDLVLGRSATGRWQRPTSALITGLIVAFVLDPGTPAWVTGGDQRSGHRDQVPAV